MAKPNSITKADDRKRGTIFTFISDYICIMIGMDINNETKIASLKKSSFTFFYELNITVILIISNKTNLNNFIFVYIIQ